MHLPNLRVKWAPELQAVRLIADYVEGRHNFAYYVALQFDPTWTGETFAHDLENALLTLSYVIEDPSRAVELGVISSHHE